MDDVWLENPGHVPSAKEAAAIRAGVRFAPRAQLASHTNFKQCRANPLCACADWPRPRRAEVTLKPQSFAEAHVARVGCLTNGSRAPLCCKHRPDPREAPQQPPDAAPAHQPRTQILRTVKLHALCAARKQGIRAVRRSTRAPIAARRFRVQPDVLLPLWLLRSPPGAKAPTARRRRARWRIEICGGAGARHSPLTSACLPVMGKVPFSSFEDVPVFRYFISIGMVRGMSLEFCFFC